MFLSFVLFICIFINKNISDCVQASEIANYTKFDDSEFVFLYPRTFLAGKNETVCSVLQSKYFPVRLKIDMKIKNKHFVYNEILYSGAECFNLSVPLHRSLEVLSATLSVYLDSHGGKQSMNSYENLLIYPPTNVLLMETDRQIYRPGDNVKIRILKLTQDMLPVLPPTKASNVNVKILNPQGFTVHAWTDVTTKLGLIHLDYQLTNETTLGTWIIECDSYRKSFLVKSYVLPSFKILVHAPKTVFIKAEEFSLKICAKYTFGNSLHGNAFIKISHQNFSLSKLQELVDGCCYWHFNFQNNKLSLEQNAKYHSINVFVSVTELGTNKMETETLHIAIQQKPYELKLLTETLYYQPGLPYKNKLKIIRSMYHDDYDYSQELAEICYQIAWKNEWNLKQPECTTFYFDKEGAIPFSILPFKENVKHVKIMAKSLNHTDPEIIANNLLLHRWHSSSGSYLKIERNSKLYTKCRSPQQFTVYFTTNKLKINEKINFYYLITTSNDILMLRQYQHSVTKSYVNFQSEIGNTIGTITNLNNKYTKPENHVDKFVIKLKTHEKIFSKGQLLVFYINKGETISNSMNIYVEKCLPINVTAKWTSGTLSPKETGTLIIKAKADSTCAVSSTDSANYLLDDSIKRLNVNKLLQPFVIRREFHLNKPNCDFSKTPSSLSKDVLVPGSAGSSKNVNNSLSYDTFEDFNNVGIATITNTQIISKPCTEQEELVSPYYQISTDDDDFKSQDDPNVIRSYFPDTWHWELIDTDKNGIILFKSKTPDTITTWNTNILCLSSDGIGVTNLKHTSLKEFFIDFAVPQKMKRFEIVNLQIVVHNSIYSLPIEISVETTLEEIREQHQENVICISPNTSTTKSIRLRALQTGNAIIKVKAKYSPYSKDCYAGSGYWPSSNDLDIVEKTIIVEYEGYPQVKAKTILMCGLDDAHNLTWNFDIAEDYIKDSESVSVVLYSDLMGPVLHNLEDLIVLPTGCGEQIMAVMTPNFYVLKYLKSINNLLPHTRKRIFKNLQIGYQKILDYRHSDGSFSAFGYHDDQGSMFLTAFVLRSLSAASEHIFIDHGIIRNALDWILSNQLENGCFASVSHVFQDMGGASLENSTSALTSYVMISLLESKQTIPENVRLNAVYCIRGLFSPDPYSLAINTYALYLLGADTDGNQGLQLLLEKAYKEENFIWWDCSKESKSMDIETTAYALMSLLHKITNDNLISANAVVRWLLNQRNSQGGFISSQDTVIALDAISRYATIMHDRNPAMNITISNINATYQAIFRKTGHLKREQFIFPKESKHVKLWIKGTGCVLTQFLLRYNSEIPKETKAFELNIAPVKSTTNCLVSTLQPCFKYTDVDQPSMIVMEIFMPSGYDPQKASLHNIIETNKNLKKIEELNDKIVFYFTDLQGQETICLPLNITRSLIISELYNASILLYQYYNPERQIIKTYSLPNECLT